MSNVPMPAGAGPWRLLILDNDPLDPKWILATVTTPGDVEPALTAPGGVAAALAGVSPWLENRLGRIHPRLVPLHSPEVWRGDENPARRQ